MIKRVRLIFVLLCCISIMMIIGCSEKSDESSDTIVSNVPSTSGGDSSDMVVTNAPSPPINLEGNLMENKALVSELKGLFLDFIKAWNSGNNEKAMEYLVVINNGEYIILAENETLKNEYKNLEYLRFFEDLEDMDITEMKQYPGEGDRPTVLYISYHIITEGGSQSWFMYRVINLHGKWYLTSDSFF